MGGLSRQLQDKRARTIAVVVHVFLFQPLQSHQPQHWKHCAVTNLTLGRLLTIPGGCAGLNTSTERHCIGHTILTGMCSAPPADSCCCCSSSLLQVGLKGLVHITGGGMTENIPRVIPKGLGVNINSNAWSVPPMFQWLQQAGKVSDAEMRRTFNMGVGLVVVVDKSQVAAARAVNPDLFELGEVVEGSGVSYV